MYNHIGKKLKALAAAWLIILILGSLAAGTLLYLWKTLDLYWCIAIAVGGILVALIGSMVMYGIGDTHVKLERLEDKLIPKPSYMSYLDGNQGLRGTCEICGKTTDLVKAKIVDQMGTRYRQVCRECYTANHCIPAE